MNIITPVAAIVGMVLGSAGFVLSVINFRRDRAVLLVRLLREEDRRNGLSPNWPAIYIEILNTGRRQIFVTRTELRIRYQRSFRWHNVANRTVDRSLAEGDAPLSEMFMLKDLPQFREMTAVQAVAYDQTGKKTLSNSLKRKRFPHLSPRPRVAS